MSFSCRDTPLLERFAPPEHQIDTPLVVAFQEDGTEFFDYQQAILVELAEVIRLYEGGELKSRCTNLDAGIRFIKAHATAVAEIKHALRRCLLFD